MKAQFATIEASISLVIIAMVISSISAWTSSATISAYSQSAALRRSMAIYDVLNSIEQNATYNYCVSQIYAGNRSCAASMESAFADMLSVRNVTVGFIAALQAQNRTVGCVAMRLNYADLTTTVCAGAYSG